MDVFLLFVSGMFISNGIPHFSNGISGRRFHSPFATPPGKGLSSAFVNVLWGFANFCVGALILVLYAPSLPWLMYQMITFASGFIFTGIVLAHFFAKFRMDNDEKSD